MARFCSLCSGSAGNSAYIGGASGGILIDAGLSAKAVSAALDSRGIDIGTIQAIFVTHEHIDHVRGLRVLATRHGIPVYATPGTIEVLAEHGDITADMNVNPIESEHEIAGMLIRHFPTCHDARESVGYTIDTPDGRRIAICTDLGHVTDEVRGAIRGCDLVMIESNHDLRMLQNGQYSYELKRRILGESGHLSNACCADELPELVQNGATRLVLAHLSHENNMPQLALASARAALQCVGMTENTDFTVTAAAPGGTDIIRF